MGVRTLLASACWWVQGSGRDQMLVEFCEPRLSMVVNDEDSLDHPATPFSVFKRPEARCPRSAVPSRPDDPVFSFAAITKEPATLGSRNRTPGLSGRHAGQCPIAERPPVFRTGSPPLPS
jgi:hypothetical protein